MTRFRPCIDLHKGEVKQIVGGSLSDQSPETLQTNHVSAHKAGYFAQLYREHQLHGTHVIMLGPGNDEAAREALSEWPDALQVGGGINELNAAKWIDAGARKVIVTSSLFPDGKLSTERLRLLMEALDHDRNRLVIDLSCRRRADSQTPTWFVAINRWQTITDTEVNQGTPAARHERHRLTDGSETISLLEPYCSEFLIHAADNEGLQRGIDGELVQKLAEWCTIPVTYAGGGSSLADLDTVKSLSGGKVDLTIGSALDIFGGSGVTFDGCVAWNRAQEALDV